MRAALSFTLYKGWFFTRRQATPRRRFKKRFENQEPENCTLFAESKVVGMLPVSYKFSGEKLIIDCLRCGAEAR